MTAPVNESMWTCPECRRLFANRNQTHTCGLSTLDHHFAGKPAAIAELFAALRGRIEAIGPVRILPEKTRIAFQVRMSFAQVTPTRRHLNGHLVLARRVEHPVFRRIDSFSPRNHVHHFRLLSEADLTDDFIAFLREAYAVGAQEHLRS